MDYSSPGCSNCDRCRRWLVCGLWLAVSAGRNCDYDRRWLWRGLWLWPDGIPSALGIAGIAGEEGCALDSFAACGRG